MPWKFTPILLERGRWKHPAIKSSSRRGRSSGRNSISRLEGELDRQLNAARTASAEERVADAHVAGGGDVVCGVANFAARTVRNESTSGAAIADWAGGARPIGNGGAGCGFVSNGAGREVGNAAYHITATGDVGIGNPFLGGGGPRGIQLAVKFTF